MDTVLFAAARHAKTKRDFLQRISGKHPAHPDKFNFADAISKREYERILRGDVSPNPVAVPNPIVFVSGDGPCSGKSTLVSELIRLRHGDQNPAPCAGGRCNNARIADAIRDAIYAGRPHVWIDDFYSPFRSSNCVRSNSLCYFATSTEAPLRRKHTSQVEVYPINLTIYISGNCLEIDQDIERRGRVIRLAHMPIPF